MSSGHAAISVIVPIFNVACYVDECLASILAQDFQSLELLVIDDGSTDESATLAAHFAEVDPRVRVITQVNQGVSAARNAGLSVARGEFVSFVDGDDWLDSDYLTNLVVTARATGADFVVSTGPGSSTAPSVERWSGSHAAAQLLTADIPIGCWNKLYRRDFLKRASIKFRRDLFMGEGLYFIAECAREAGTIVAVGPVGYHYRLNNSQSATSVPSVEKMRNALHSISLISDVWEDGGSEVANALSYQRSWTLFSGLVDAVVLGDDVAVRDFATGIQSIDWAVPIRVKGSVNRRVKAVAFRVAPRLFARLAAHREESAR